MKLKLHYNAPDALVPNAQNLYVLVDGGYKNKLISVPWWNQWFFFVDGSNYGHNLQWTFTENERSTNSIRNGTFYLFSRLRLRYYHQDYVYVYENGCSFLRHHIIKAYF